MNLLKRACPDTGNHESCLIKLDRWVFSTGILLQTLTNHPVPTLESKMTTGRKEEEFSKEHYKSVAQEKLCHFQPWSFPKFLWV